MTSADSVGTSVDFVEKALVGSLLNNPALRGQVPWLGVDDFTNPLCRALWTYLGTHQPTQPQPLGELVDLSDTLGRETELHPRLRTPAELATLMLHAPEGPAVAEYGRILVEATTRRQVAAMGLRLDGLATRHPEAIVDQVANALTSLDVLRRRWHAALGQRQQAQRGPADTVDVQSSPPNQRGATVASRESMDPQMAQHAVIGAAVHDWPPGARTTALHTVHAADFTDRRAAATWHAVEALARRGAPIDVVTVTWETLRARSRNGDGYTIGQLQATRNAAIFHEAAAVTLARSSLARVISRAQQSTTRHAGDLGVNLACVLDSTATQHAAVAAAAQRLTSDRTRLGTRHGAGPAKTRELTV